MTIRAPETPLERRVAALIVEHLHVDEPETIDDLFEAGVLDSLSFVTLLTALEREFDIQVPLDALELDRFGSVAAIARYVAQRLDHDHSPRAHRG
ncbi:MAG TPA: acyl carrier protein [Vicinamibacterales bacterium]